MNSNISKAIKKESKMIFTNSWGKAFMATVILLLPIGFTYLLDDFIVTLSQGFSQDPPTSINQLAIVIISLVTALSIIFLIGPTYLGVLKWFYLKSKGENENVFICLENFTSFQRYKTAVKFTLPMQMRVVLYFLLFAIPSIVFGFLASTTLYVITERLFILLAFISGVIMFTLFCTVIFKSAILTPIAYFEKYENGTFKEHRNNVQGIIFSTHPNISQFNFTFIWWFMLCFFVVPIYFVIPYYLESIVTNAKWIMNMAIPKNQMNNEDYEQQQ